MPASTPADARPPRERCSGRQRISTQTIALGPDGRLLAQPELDRNAARAGAAPRQRGEIGRSVGDMDALEQAVSGELLRRLAQQLLRGMRGKEDAALLVMTRDHVGRVLGEQPVALLADADRIFRSPMNSLYGDGETGGVDDGAHGAKKAEQIGRHREQSAQGARSQVPRLPRA